MALPRCSAGHVSATSTDPADHSAPKPNPTSARQKASSAKLWAVAVSPVGKVSVAETAPTDYYWGVGRDGTGQNRLGKIMERIRAELRAGADAGADGGRREIRQDGR